MELTPSIRCDCWPDMSPKKGKKTLSMDCTWCLHLFKWLTFLFCVTNWIQLLFFFVILETIHRKSGICSHLCFCGHHNQLHVHRVRIPCSFMQINGRKKSMLRCQTKAFSVEFMDSFPIYILSSNLKHSGLIKSRIHFHFSSRCLHSSHKKKTKKKLCILQDVHGAASHLSKVSKSTGHFPVLCRNMLCY